MYTMACLVQAELQEGVGGADGQVRGRQVLAAAGGEEAAKEGRGSVEGRSAVCYAAQMAMAQGPLSSVTTA